MACRDDATAALTWPSSPTLLIERAPCEALRGRRGSAHKSPGNAHRASTAHAQHDTEKASRPRAPAEEHAPKTVNQENDGQHTHATNTAACSRLSAAKREKATMWRTAVLPAVRACLHTRAQVLGPRATKGKVACRSSCDVHEPDMWALAWPPGVQPQRRNGAPLTHGARDAPPLPSTTPQAWRRAAVPPAALPQTRDTCTMPSPPPSPRRAETADAPSRCPRPPCCPGRREGGRPPPCAAAGASRLVRAGGSVVHVAGHAVLVISVAAHQGREEGSSSSSTSRWCARARLDGDPPAPATQRPLAAHLSVLYTYLEDVSVSCARAGRQGRASSSERTRLQRARVEARDTQEGSAPRRRTSC